MNCNACSADLKEFKKSFEWLKEVDSVSLQSSIKDLDVAYQKFFKEHSGFPKFKSKRITISLILLIIKGVVVFAI